MHKAMMTGLAYARGDLVFLTDSDLEEAPELLETFYERLRTTEADVVFGVQRAYYALCAAKAAVTAARQNLELAQSDFDAVQQRLKLGLATEPALIRAIATPATPSHSALVIAVIALLLSSHHVLASPRMLTEVSRTG